MFFRISEVDDRYTMPGTSYPTNNDNFSNGFPTITTQSERLLQSQSRRKFSFPATLHSAALLEVGQRETTRRRLSNVSDVVTRKLSYTIGWKAAQIPAQDIITQVKGSLHLPWPCLINLIAFYLGTMSMWTIYQAKVAPFGTVQ